MVLRPTLTLGLLSALFFFGCSGDGGDLRTSGESCVSSDECASNLCYESLCFEASADDDGDGLINALEASLGTKATLADTDGDGLSDGEEVAGLFDDPPDADGDSKIDALESALISSALEGGLDVDGDCLAPQVDPDDKAPNLTCCCDGDCAEQAISVLSASCSDSGAAICTFDPADDLDADGMLAPCDDDDDGDGIPDDEDCAPGDAERHSAVIERCDGVDNNCDGDTDEPFNDLLMTPCLTAHPDCGGTVMPLCAEDGEGVYCPKEPAPEGTLCDDGNPESEGDACDAAGNCSGIVCQPSAECLSADLGEGLCVMTVKPGFCFIDETCIQAGQAHADFPCKRCDPEREGEAWTLLEAGSLCDDGDPETLADLCTAQGECEGKLCDQGGECTTSEVQDGSCVYTPLPGSCYIEGLCYEEGELKSEWPCKRCDPLLSQEAWSVLAEGVTCDDGDLCTLEDVCSAEATCVGKALDCEDDFPCTLDSCEAASGCVHVPQDAACDDGIACTQDVCALSEGCLFQPLDALCDEGDPCWTPLCDPLQGCANTYSGAEGCLFPCEITQSVVGTSAAADGGTTGHAVFAGELAFIVQQSTAAKELSVIDASDPSAPEPLDLFSTADNAWDTSLDLPSVSLPRRALIDDPSGPLYISSSAGFHVIDLLVPLEPQVVATAGAGMGQLYGMAHHPFADVIYGALEGGGILSINISKSTTPLPQVTSASLAVETFDVAIGPANRLFLAGYDLSVQSFDIVAPLAPNFITSLEGIAEPTNFAESVIATSGALLALANNRDGYRLVDISNPNAMSVVFEGESPSRIYDLAFFGGYLLLASEDQGLVIVDIADPSDPQSVATIPLTGTPRGVAVDNHRVFVSTSSVLLEIIDLTLPCNDDDPCTLDGCHVEEGCNFGAALPCDDLDPCTADSCSSQEGGCVYEPLDECPFGAQGAP